MRKLRTTQWFMLLSLVALVFALVACGPQQPAADANTAGTGSTTAPAAASTTDSLDRILKDGVLKVAIPQDTPLFGIQGANGEYEGYDVEFANMLAKDLDVKVELVPVTSQNRIPYLTSEKVDLVIANMGVKPERAEVINFSNPYAPFFWGAYGSKDLAVAGPADVKPYKVGATLGTLEEIAITGAAPEGTVIERYADQATTVQAFLSGQVDIIVCSNAIAAQIVKDHPEMKVEQKFILQQSPCHIGVRRGDTALLSWVNSAIYFHMLNGDLNKLSNKWFNEPLPTFLPY